MQPCPRMSEGPPLRGIDPPHWREDGRCSFCGSISPEEFFKAVENGATIDPTDKSYKVYVNDEDPRAGEPCVYTISNRPREGMTEVTAENISTLPPGPHGHRSYQVGEWVEVSQRSAHRTRKFYFQHLSPAQQDQFIELYNSKRMKMGMPGAFYVLPYFARRKE